MHYKFINKYYFINSFDTKYLEKLDKNTGIIYRNYKAKIDINLIKKINNYCKKNNLKFFLSNNIKLAIKLNLNGAYLPSFNKNMGHLSYSLKKNFILIGSAHNNNELKFKEKQLVKIVFLSSIFKKNKNYLGLNKFKLLAKSTNLKVVALGGISIKNRKRLKLLNCFGFAGISYFE